MEFLQNVMNNEVKVRLETDVFLFQFMCYQLEDFKGVETVI